MNNNSPIGFFDSGVGGLSVYSRFRELMPAENTIYFGDLKNLPYGNKTQAELISFAKNILNFFKTQDVKAVAIACNTSSALAYDFIKNEYDFPIYPIIQSCAKIIADMRIKKLGVFATEGTVKTKAYSKEISKYNSSISVKEIACPNWVSIVEKSNPNIDKFEDIRSKVKEMEGFCPDKIILGCTHYPYLLEDLKTIAPEYKFIDPAEIFAKFLSEIIPQNNSNEIGDEQFFVSATPELFVENSKLFYEIKQNPQIFTNFNNI
jgi:glutamate racemase